MKSILIIQWSSPFFNAPKAQRPRRPRLRVDPGTATLLLEDSRSLEEAAGISRGAVGSGSVWRPKNSLGQNEENHGKTMEKHGKPVGKHGKNPWENDGKWYEHGVLVEQKHWKNHEKPMGKGAIDSYRWQPCDEIVSRKSTNTDWLTHYVCHNYVCVIIPIFWGSIRQQAAWTFLMLVSFFDTFVFP